MRVLVLDSLFDSLEIESHAAVDQGSTLERWTEALRHSAKRTLWLMSRHVSTKR